MGKYLLGTIIHVRLDQSDRGSCTEYKSPVNSYISFLENILAPSEYKPGALYKNASPLIDGRFEQKDNYVIHP